MDKAREIFLRRYNELMSYFEHPQEVDLCLLSLVRREITSLIDAAAMYDFYDGGELEVFERDAGHAYSKACIEFAFGEDYITASES